jgi:tol-pal system protein YbgF
VLVCAAVSACAVSPEEDPVQIKLHELDGRLQRIERANQSVVEMAQKLDSTESEVRSLRGRIDELQNNNEALKRQQRELYSDLDKRLTTANAAGETVGGAGAGVTGASAGPGAPGGAGSSTGTEQAAYSQSFDALKASNYPAAISGFKSFLASFPASPLAENAQYWLGEAHYAKGDYDQAAMAFQAVGQRWPNSRKSPDALLKLGYSQIEMKRYSEARVTLADVTRRFPDSDAAKLAAERLRKLPVDSR